MQSICQKNIQRCFNWMTDARRTYRIRWKEKLQNRGVAMSKTIATSMAATLIVVGMASQIRVASATPVSNVFAAKNGVQIVPQTVLSGKKRYESEWHEASWRSERWGRPPYYGYGFAAGTIFGGWLAAPYILPGPYQYSDPYIDGPRSESAVDYCMHRFKSYDRNSGTYLGHDRSRHPCP